MELHSFDVGTRSEAEAAAAVEDDGIACIGLAHAVARRVVPTASADQRIPAEVLTRVVEERRDAQTEGRAANAWLSERETKALMMARREGARGEADTPAEQVGLRDARPHVGVEARRVIGLRIDALGDTERDFFDHAWDPGRIDGSCHGV